LLTVGDGVGVGPSFRFIGGWGMDVTDGWPSPCKPLGYKGIRVGAEVGEIEAADRDRRGLEGLRGWLCRGVKAARILGIYD
jgi:hypothetical protein